MAILKEKSNFNFDAAQLLIEKNLYAPSVHCSYYSCFQLMKFAMNDFLGISYEQLYRNIGSSSYKTHNYIINVIGQTIKSYNRQIFRSFDNKIRDLKLLREESDYDEIEIDTNKSNNALNQAKDIRNILFENLNL